MHNLTFCWYFEGDSLFSCHTLTNFSKSGVTFQNKTIYIECLFFRQIDSLRFHIQNEVLFFDRLFLNKVDSYIDILHCIEPADLNSGPYENVGYFRVTIVHFSNIIIYNYYI